ncbi:amino acid adenylation domain-containing protein [Pseudomonas lijiangensis]|uniref:amino acid adenylation domain-containing protein n=1 Tax=Pseudomonas lijiangensis TaxID=2995658 RepID=UPI0031BB72A3
MNLIELLATLEEKGVELSVSGEQLAIRGRKQSLAEPAVLALLRENKAMLIESIKNGTYATTLASLQNVPANGIVPGCERITADMLPLLTLDQAAIDRIVASIPGGTANVQDIYPLAPLQEGVLYHHLTAERGDPYVLQADFTLASRERLDDFVAALQSVIDRHDILRTSLVWEGLDEPVQVVWREAKLGVRDISHELEEGEVLPQLKARFDPRHYRLDIGQAPLMLLVVSEDKANQRWLGMLLFHHLAIDHAALEIVQREMQAFLTGQSKTLQAPVPYRNYVAQTRQPGKRQGHEAFFGEMLGDMDEPTLPFGLQDVLGDGNGVEEAHLTLSAELGQRLRAQTRQLGVSAASLCHLAWARVLSVVSGRDDVVFGTVMLGRMQSVQASGQSLGMFINTLPLRVRIGGQNARDGVSNTHATLTQLLGHEHASLALAQRCSGVVAPTPLFSALLNYRHSADAGQPLDAQTLDAWKGIETLSAEERTNYPLILSVDDFGEHFALNVQASVQIGAQRVAGYMASAMTHLVSALEAGGQTELTYIPVLPEAECEQLLHGFNHSAADYPRDSSIHALFEQQVAERPEALAAVHGEQTLTYAGLNSQANRLAHYLISQGVNPGDAVAILLPRSLDLLVAQLAISKCSGIYVPLDVNAPQERQAFMVQDSGARQVLTHGDLEVPQGAARSDLDRLDLAQQSDANPDRACTGESAAYIMYTSGSTGTPKGVLVPHRAIARLVIHNGYAEFTASDRVAFASNPAFDASTLDVWAPLLNGGCVVVVDQDVLLSLPEFKALLLEQSVSVLWMTAGLFHQYASGLYDAFAQLRYLIVGGDVLDPSVIAQVLKNGAPEHLLNGYGPTEATTFSATHEIKTVGEGSIPIGKPLANTRLYVLDARQQPVPLGVTGELYIGGDGVALGYLNRAELTEQVFVADPFSTDPTARLYRTGDLACWLADGTVEYRGRNDQQVKIRGFRIEPGEIETLLASHEAVKEAVVLVREDVPGDKRLVAYFTSTQADIDLELLRNHLQGQLPDYMVPAAYVQLDSLPLTNNGKLDRKALPAPDQQAFINRGYEAPQGDIETTLAQIWAEVLQVERVGRHDHFFELGGHSLLAVKLIEKMRQEGLSADVRVLFSQPTLAALAAAVGSGTEIRVPANLIEPGCTRITPDMLPLVELDQNTLDLVIATVPGGAANVQDIYPLAPLQQGILYHHISAEQGDPYVLQATFSVKSRERLDAFANALRHVIQRHDILRTAVVWKGLSEPLQVVWREADLSVEFLKPDPRDGAIAEQLSERFASSHYRLDLAEAPLIRLACARDGDSWVMLLIFHHLALDHTAMDVVREEMQAFMLGEADSLPAAVPYRNYVAQARLGLGQEEHEAFFRDMLGDVDEPTLAYGQASLPDDGGHIEEARVQLDTALCRRVRVQARQLGVSAASLMHLVWALVASKASGRAQTVFGTVLMGRMQGGDGADRALGMFINTLPLRVDIDGRSVVEGVKSTHARLSALLGHEHASLALAQRSSAVAAPSPLFNSLLNYRHSAADMASSQALSAWEGIESLSNAEGTNYPLAISVDDLGEGFVLSVLAMQEIGARRVCDTFAYTLQQLVEALDGRPQTALHDVPVIAPQERQRLLETFNATTTDYPRDQTLQPLFEAQVAERPEALAAVHGEQSLTYAELNRRANRLAHYLAGKGVKAGDAVAILLPRSLDLLVAQLAITKCAALYVPLDVNAPLDRQAFMVRDSGARQLLTFHDREIPEGAERLDLDRLDVSSQPDQNPQNRNTAESAAYIMYTSGSTGTPKGVIVAHRGIVKLVRNNGFADFNQNDRLAFASNPAFDASTLEVWGALLNGGQVVVIDHELLLDPPRLAEELVEKAITSLFVTTAVFNQYVSLIGETLAGLRILMCGGERADPQVFRDLLAIAPDLRLIHCYGPTETTTYATTLHVTDVPLQMSNVPIGKPLANTQVYVLDARQQLVPTGVAGEICIGGDGVALGYLNRPELTAQAFIADPFSAVKGARLYRSGDRGCWRADGSLEHLGRGDGQVKIRGFRIEPGEIDARLKACPGVHQASVVIREDVPGQKQLVAYYTAESADSLLTVQNVQAWLREALPEYMVPSAFVRLEHWPLNNNGKLDQKALPVPDAQALTSSVYEAPSGDVEALLASIWSQVLKVERVGRFDNFFSLGGHSLLAVTLIERMRQEGLRADIKVLFNQPTLAALAASLTTEQDIQVPANLIPADCQRIEPWMLPLASLEQTSIDDIVAAVPGGVANVQDIYALAPLQEGILYHHVAAREGDPFILQSLLAMDSEARLKSAMQALQKVIERHDILRTAVFWKGLEAPVQVVLRHATLSSECVELDPEDGDILGQMRERFDALNFRMDISQAPLICMPYAWDSVNQRYVVALVFHHMIMDHVAFDVVVSEIQSLLLDEATPLPEPVPYRNYIAQVRLGADDAAHERFFRDMLQDVREPTLPFGQQVSEGVMQEIHDRVDTDIAQRVRSLARSLGVSAASLYHLAWGLVVGRVSASDDVVFGTVLVGRMRGGEGADRALGMFINTLPIRVELGQQTVAQAVRQVHVRLSGLLEHEHAPLALAQRCSGVAAPAPLFGALLNFRHSAADDSAQAHTAWQGIQGLEAHEHTAYPLSLAVDDTGAGYLLTVQASGGIDVQALCDYMQCALQNMIEALEQAPSTALNRISILPDAERLRLLTSFNDTDCAYPDQATVHGLFEAQAQRTPDAVAVVHGEQSLTYRQLDQQANRLAHCLTPLLGGQNAPVALCVERGLEMLVGLLGILKAGGCYVPLDPGYPADRLNYMLADSSPVALLTLGSAPDGLDSGSIPVIALDRDAQWRSGPTAPVERETDARQLAYVIYTSGSTGRPKGVMLEQRGVVNLLCAMRDLTRTGPEDRMLALTTISFDIAGLELYMPLICGACTVLLDRHGAQDPVLLAEAIAQSGATMMQATPATWRLLLDSGWSGAAGLKALCGGEALPLDLAQRVAARVGTLWNVYGPTETTIWSSALEFDASDRTSASVSIGRPIANNRFYLLDEQGEPVPIGVAAELYIGGDGVARGYLNWEQLTAERFIDDPFSSKPGARLYRTGDLARYRPDGSLEYLGRNDFQVKIRGYRIELGEIEARLGAVPGIREAVVVAVNDAHGDLRLAGYYTGENCASSLLRESLLANLPEFMVPTVFVHLEKLPLTPNGKLDRKALPAPETDITRHYEAPRGEQEISLAATWAELLKVERIGRDDNFFELGGHSLLAMRLVSQVRQQWGVELQLAELFAHPQLSAVAEQIALATRSTWPDITPVSRDEALPLSFAQQRLLFLAKMEGASAAYHLPAGLRLRGALDVSALQRALDRIVARHEALRTCFVQPSGGAAVQRILPPGSGFALTRVDISGLDDPSATLNEMTGQEALQGFDLQHGPLIRGQLIRLAEQEHVLLVTMHHIVSDGWSMGVLTAELGALYAAFVRGEADPLPELTLQYADYAAWQRRLLEGEALKAQTDWWRKTLSQAPAVLTLPTDEPRPALQDYSGAAIPVCFDAQLTAQLHDLSKRHGTTLYMTVLAAWAATLGRLSGQDQVVIGSPVANRMNAEVEGLIGLFVNTLALPIDLSGKPDFAELLHRVRTLALEAQARQALPFEHVVEVVKPVRSLSHSPLFQVMLSWQNNESVDLQLGDLTLEGIGAPRNSAKFDLSLDLGEVNGQLQGSLEFATALFYPQTIERYRGYLERLLRAMVADAGQPVYGVALPDEAERLHLARFNDTQHYYPPAQTVHGLFEAQVLRTPDAPALIHGGEQLNYRQLNERANRLAWHLRARGVEPDARVAICMERGTEMVVGLLAILKAGGGYVPLDPAYPVERIAYMLEDSSPTVVLAHGPTLGLLSATRAPVIDLDNSTWLGQPPENPDVPGLSASHLAYVIYTSGSTGMPKGVMIEHRNTVNFLTWAKRAFEPSVLARTLFSTSLNFDLAVYECFAPLTTGGCIDLVKNALELQRNEHDVTLINTVPSALKALLESTGLSQGVHTVNVAGEALKRSLVEKLFEETQVKQLCNLYGPSETTTYSSWVAMDRESGFSAHIGKPISNTRFHVLDEYLNPVPLGVAGELFIGGAGVARGYLNRDELTVERFLDDPFSDVPGARMYRTGDLGRWLPDGNIEYLGRNDDQVKIRGFRIELGEVEARLAGHEAVRDAVVLAREDEPGDVRLVAYYTLQSEKLVVDSGLLRAHLQAQLPEYMVPAAYVHLDTLPLTPNGKLDRKRLPLPDSNAYVTHRYEAPQGENETRLAMLWAELLKVERVGRHDHFFELGGHSLLAVSLIERMRQEGLEADVRVLFGQSTLAAVAASVVPLRTVEVSASRVPTQQRKRRI